VGGHALRAEWYSDVSMSEERSKPVIAILNNNEDLIRMLSDALKEAGCNVASVRLVDVRAGKVDLELFVKEHDPDAVLFDIALPYRTTLSMLEDLKATGVLAGRGLVLTTPNVRATRDLLRVNAFEITGLAEEIQVVVQELLRVARRPEER
jgi:CheY-like chemotaxis protein